MKIIGLDHLVLNIRDLDAALSFYGGSLGLEVLRLEQFQRGEIGFVSVRVSDGSIIDLRPSEETPEGPVNVDHFCLVVGRSDMEALIVELQSQGVKTEGPVRSRWGARGNGLSFHVWDPEGNKIELKSYGF